MTTKLETDISDGVTAADVAPLEEILRTLRYFRDEYEAHVREKRCPAHSCISLIKFTVNPELCKRCGQCFKACPAGAVAWEKKQVATIDREKCVKCKNCIMACKFNAIE